MRTINLIFGTFFKIILIFVLPGYGLSSDSKIADVFGSVSILENYIYENETVTVGIRINLNNGWKSYWKHSGNIGLPTRIKIEENDNMKSFTILWPRPEVEESDEGISLIYKNDIVIPISIQLNNINIPTKFKLAAEFGVCKDICMPVTKNLYFELKKPTSSFQKNILNLALDRVPKSSLEENLNELTCSLKANQGKFILEFVTELPDRFSDSWAVLEYGRDMLAMLKTEEHIKDQKLFFTIKGDNSKENHLFIDKSKFKLNLISKHYSFFFLGCN